MNHFIYKINMTWLDCLPELFANITQLLISDVVLVSQQMVYVDGVG